MRGFIVIGGPVAKRAWILDHWFNFVHQAMARTEYGYRFVFVCDPKDTETLDIIHRRTSRDGKNRTATVVEVEDPPDAGTRNWGLRERKERMVELRNLALAVVRRHQPVAYLSLDSDILIHPEAVASMLDASGGYGGPAAVGGRCYMTPLPQGASAMNPRSGVACPSYLIQGRAGQFRRRDPESPGVFPVDVIMAIKMMGPDAYNVDYQYHQHGEDIGWSLACGDLGLRLLWDGRVTSKHVMMPEHLHVLDPRVGY